MFDGEGNAWTGVNFIVGSQASDELWDGNLSKFAPNGKALSPATTGFQGGGIEGPGFGTAVDANGKVWVTSTGSKTISFFDKNGNPLSPPEGYNFGGQQGIMQGIIVAPNGDVWTLDFGKDQVVYLPKGDANKVKFFCVLPTEDRTGIAPANRRSLPSCDRPAGSDLDHERNRRHRHSISGQRSEQGRSASHRRAQRQGNGDRQSGERVDHEYYGDWVGPAVKLKLLELKLTGQNQPVPSRRLRLP